MPAFIKNPKDEAKWNKAKEAAGKTLTEADGDKFWALTNSIYQKMSKAKEELEKARKLSDEHDPNEPDEGPSDLEGLSEFDPDEESSGEDWLKENDPEHAQGDDYEEYDDGEDEEAHRRGIEEDLGDMGEGKSNVEAKTAAAGSSRHEEGPQASIKAEDKPEEVAGKQGRFRQPSKEELNSMRTYTRPWEQRARETSRLQADPSKNPVLAHQGNIIEARNQWHNDRKGAYQKLTSSNEYKNADPVSQMEMDDNFEKEWHSKNPEHLQGAMQAHHEAHEKGKGAKDLHAAAKDAKIRSVLEGGASGGETYSTEEGLQHAGGVKGEEGTEGSIKQDPAASFAMGNQDFIRQYAQDYNKKGKKVGNIDDMMDYNEGSQKDIGRILGDAPAKDPKFEQFFSHYYPLIGMSANRTINKLGLDPKHPDIDMSMLHEAGMHGLVQAMNDYDHDNPSKASFATHAGNKIRGLQMTAMRNQDQIPSEVRQAQKKFMTQGPKVDLHSVIKQTGHPKAPDMSDRLKRVGAQRQAQTIRRSTKPPTGGGTSGN
jgi:hypothetical protein